MSNKYPYDFAFPVTGQYAQPGMTLRDWFAGQALAGMDCHKYPSGKVAQWAYNIADAMMEARK